MNPQNMYAEHQHGVHRRNGNSHPRDINVEPSPRDSHADANEEVQGFFPTPLPRKPHTPSSYMNIPQHQQRGTSKYEIIMLCDVIYTL